MLNSDILIDVTAKMASLFGLLVNLLFQINSKADNDIVLNENGALILKNKEIADTFSNHFGSIVDNLNLQYWNETSDMPSLGLWSKELNYIINKYKNHPSIKTIKQNFQLQGGSRVDSAFHPSEVDKMSTSTFWELNGKK